MRKIRPSLERYEYAVMSILLPLHVWHIAAAKLPTRKC